MCRSAQHQNRRTIPSLPTVKKILKLREYLLRIRELTIDIQYENRHRAHNEMAPGAVSLVSECVALSCLTLFCVSVSILSSATVASRLTGPLRSGRALQTCSGSVQSVCPAGGGRHPERTAGERRTGANYTAVRAHVHPPEVSLPPYISVISTC